MARVKFLEESRDVSLFHSFQDGSSASNPVDIGTSFIGGKVAGA
jgi:hypothetical protein